jgi:capsular polysaccharide biosynthesis protein
LAEQETKTDLQGVAPANEGTTAIVVQNSDNAEEIDLLEIFFALVHNWRVILLGTLIGAFIFGLIHVIFIKPSYQASTELYITSNDSVISLQDLQIGTAIAEDYRFIITSRSVLNQVIESLQLDLDYDQLKKLIEVTNPNGTHIIRTSVKTGDLELSRDIANKLLSTSIERIYQVVGASEPSVIDYSEASAVEDVSPSFKKFILIGALIGFLVVAVIIIIRVSVNSTIRTEDDVEKYLNLTVLAAIPYYDEK